MLQRLEEDSKDLSLIGDGRCDYPGFNAKYGTYTLTSDQNDEIIDFFVAHVSNTGNSQNMKNMDSLIYYSTYRVKVWTYIW